MCDASEKTETSDEQPDEQPAEKEADTSNVIICHRHKWSSEEKELLKQLFATQIKTKKDKVRSFFKLDSTESESSLPPQEEEESAEEKVKVLA
ncbi:Hypothetical predicted protein [Paramuricea clavata]|uniref:Uncharacterized protein n=1 Tax=Paramuricea clavata TaxID=317549 RepID=A0A6S7FXC2_PARCT|nr:Hypothetical predicted protein [Paramuricea clavata]